MLRQLLFNKENCLETVTLLLVQLGVKVTDTTLANDLYNHPDYPSLLSISDVLQNYGIESLSFKTTIEKLVTLPTPFIAQIKENSSADIFTVVRAVSGNIINHYDPETHQWQNSNATDFAQKWQSHIILLPDATEKKDEENFRIKKRNEIRLSVAKYSAFLLLPVIAIGLCVWSLVNNGFDALYPAVFLLLTTLGTIVSALLIWYELDQYNPVLQQICSGGKKVNCGAILKSGASKIGGVSWSSIGFTYFAGGLFVLLFTGLFTSSTLFTVTWLNALAVPYIFFSLYYQWQVARQWCVLCLAVQVLLALQFATALTAGWHTITPVASLLSLNFLVPFMLCYSLPFIMVSLLLPAWQSAKESRRNKTELQRLKHNPQIFEALLSKQKAIQDDTKGLGITLGNQDASVKIIKVCNPYCGPCAKAHTPIEELLHNNPDIQVQIIFNATSEENDVRAKPVKHLLAIQEKDGQPLTEKALDDWYLADKKDYDVFAAKYPMNGELKKQDEKVEAMSEWCNKTEIAFTPTFFINGNQLPNIYNVQDLKYFLSK